MKKQFLSILLIGVLSFSLCACGDTYIETTAQIEENTEQQTTTEETTTQPTEEESQTTEQSETEKTEEPQSTEEVETEETTTTEETATAKESTEQQTTAEETTTAETASEAPSEPIAQIEESAEQQTTAEETTAQSTFINEIDNSNNIVVEPCPYPLNTIIIETSEYGLDYSVVYSTIYEKNQVYLLRYCDEAGIPIYGERNYFQNFEKIRDMFGSDVSCLYHFAYPAPEKVGTYAEGTVYKYTHGNHATINGECNAKDGSLCQPGSITVY